ncbi:GTP-binding protein EngB required for normal cell division [Flavimobilis soli]|uniref:GTP-binding protein EngB required for normal cell division n=1 Tax=Flavimobilis soli TaxID=442709 RepID=A0A2A9ECP4_9MICO|nr:GTPase [Flavimobilis soli]PFG36042.1 GTP-binding protein EngB required for normal cell division [Flavimobilis soli]
MSSARRDVPADASEGVLGRVEALEEAWLAGRDVLADADPGLARDVEELLPRVRERVALGADRTVVALAGSTGSGKSSLLNAVAGAEVARPGVLRPTTSRAVAAVWPGSSPAALLDWLEVTQRTFVDGEEGADGLVLLDLPDHDSVVPEHRVRADRLLARADLMVWVTDPQKYADAALHEGYLRGFSGYEGVVVVVLNHADRLSDDDRETCLADLRERVAEDGLPNAHVLATSATEGLGVTELRGLVADAVRRRQAMAARLLEDVRACARRILELTEPPSDAPRLSGGVDDRLVQALLGASGAETVVDAVGLSARRQVRTTAGWPVTRWVASLRADPLRRLGLRPDPDGERPDAATTEVRRSSMPRPTAAVRARTAEALREHADGVARALPEAWQPTTAARPDPDVLADALDQVVVAAPLGSPGPPRWARALGWVQTLLLVVALAGLAWLAALAGLDALRLPAPDVSWHVGDATFPWPTTLAVGGLAAGALVGAIAGLFGRTTAARRRRQARAALEAGVRGVAEATVVGPARARLDTWRACRAAAERAASGPTRRRSRMA